MKPTQLFLILLFVCSVALISCDTLFRGGVSGTWISADETDTIIFIKGMQLKRNINEYDVWDYSTWRNQITIQYYGPSNVNVPPTTHTYSKFAGKMTIDFSNELCYGFGQRKITLYKQ